MTDIPSGWQINESLKQARYVRGSHNFPEYAEGLVTPTRRSHAGYVSEDESTIVSVNELNHPGNPDDTELFIYLYEHGSTDESAYVWLFTAEGGVTAVTRVARKLVVARHETPHSRGDFKFIPYLRERVPKLAIHTEHSAESLRPGHPEHKGMQFELPEPTGHPLELYLQGFVVGTQFQRNRPSFSCQDADCKVELEGNNHTSWELNSSLFLFEQSGGELFGMGWRCSEHPVDSLEPFVAEIPGPETVSTWRERLEKEDRMIDEKVSEMKRNGTLEINSDTDHATLELAQKSQARQELEIEGVLEERTSEDNQTCRRVRNMMAGPDVERFHLIRCDFDCMCFGGHHQSISYIRSPSAIDQADYAEMHD
jgi:hypothetical protein